MGFRGMERDDEVKGRGDSYDFGARMYDPRVGRWWSCDALERKYPSLSPYVFCNSNPIVFKDNDGNEGVITIVDNEHEHIVTLESTIFLVGAEAKDMFENGWLPINGERSFTRLVKDKNIEGKVWIVTMKVHYAYDDAVDNYVNSKVKMGEELGLGVSTEWLKRNTVFKAGDNLLQVDPEVDIRGVGKTGQGAYIGTINMLKSNSNGSDAFRKVLIHESLHQLGFDERYFTSRIKDHDGFQSDFMGALDVWEPENSLEMNAVHFVDLLDFALGRSSQEGSSVVDKDHLQIDNTERGDIPESKSNFESKSNRVISDEDN